jgi:hypothetical protein
LVESNDESALDLLVRGKTESSSSKDDYYFSGLAFSPMPLVSAVRDKYSKVASFNTRDDFSFLVKIGDNQVVKKRIVSLHLLEKVEGEWKIHEPARLPVVKHGQDRDSVVIDNLQISRLRANELFSNEAVLDTVDIGSATAEKINVTKTASIEELNVSQVNAYHINIDNKPVPTVELKESGGYYQLQFTLGN